MNSKDFLIEWIHRVEFNLGRPPRWMGDKEIEPGFSSRLPSLITEIYFEYTIAKNPLIQLPEKLITGWIRSEGESFGNNWYKIHSGIRDSELTEINQQFIAEIWKKRPGDNFFAIRHSVECSKDRSVPELTFDVRVVDKKSLLPDRTDFERSKRLNEKVKREIALRDTLNEGTPHEIFFNSLSERQLGRLLATRCVMNFGRLKGPTDLDALYRKDGKLGILEFKKKYPAEGYWTLDNGQPLSGADYIPEASDLMGKLKALVKGSQYRLDEHGWKKTPGECLGLDLSHGKNVMMCENLGWTYSYVIWNHPKKRAVPSDLFEMKDGLLTALTTPTIFHLLVNARHVSGISSTSGKDSGEYDNGTRLQVMIPISHFN